MGSLEDYNRLNISMSKSLLVVLIAIFVLGATAHSMDEAMKAYKNDKCVAAEIDTFKPQISAKIAQLKEVLRLLFRITEMLLPRLN